jgi:alanyl-tRNA synthetase
VLGDVVDQKGSLVAPEKFRFDYSCKSSPSPDQLAEVEKNTNEFIKKSMKVYTLDVPLSQAKEITGLRAVFGEVYPDPVRVVSVGYPVEDLLADPTIDRNTSIEFCGGTHVSSTQDIKRFVIVDDSALAKGIRRMTGVTGEEAAKLRI